MASLQVLDEFKRRWAYHHPLQAEQLDYADRTGMVTSVRYYHGGDVLYELEGIPGIWHEACLTSPRD